MNMKNTIILLIFLLSVLGLIMGVYYSEGMDADNSDDEASGEVVLTDSGVGDFDSSNNQNIINTFFK